jgi:hypothetical protein
VSYRPATGAFPEARSRWCLGPPPAETMRISLVVVATWEWNGGLPSGGIHRSDPTSSFCSDQDCSWARCGLRLCMRGTRRFCASSLGRHHRPLIGKGDSDRPPGDVRHRQRPGRSHQVELVIDGEPQHAVVPLSDVVVGPEQGLARLRVGPVGAVEAAEILHLVEVLRVLRARERIRSVRSELRWALQGERQDPWQAETEDGANRVRLPHAWTRQRRVEVAERRVLVPAVVLAEGQPAAATSAPAAMPSILAWPSGMAAR